MGYDKRGRLSSLKDGSIYNFSLGYANNSNVLTGTDSINGGWTYTYDDMARLSTASKTGEALNWTYDPVNNRWQQNVTAGMGGQPQYVFDANNHITSASGVAYDAAGNVINDSFYQYQYDAEGRMTKVLTTGGATIATYSYDAFGHRVRTAATQTADFIFDPAGRVLDQLSGSTWQRGEIYAGGMHLATYNNLVTPASTFFEHSDWVGSVRARSNVSGASVETCTNFPFGDSQSCTNTDESAYHFATMMFDSESNLQHTWFRQYNTTEGRWTVPDPAGLAAVNAGNPQTWNRYSYAVNNPVTFADPMGLEDCVWDPEDGSYHDEEGLPCTQPPLTGGGSPTPGPNGGGGGAANKRPKVFTCASEFGSKVSIAGGLQALGIGKSGVGGFITNALGGNAFSGATDLVQSIATGEGGGNSVFYNMAQGVVAGPTQGFGSAFGNSIEGTPWASGPADVATTAIVANTQNIVTGAGETIQTLNGAVQLGGVLGEAAEWASGFGLVKLGYDALSYGTGLVGCKLGVIK